jgi:ABC-type antimicrobial peptide transport system permease subunit
MFHILSLLRNLLHRDRVERDLDDEVRAMFDLLVDERVGAGMSREEASRAARMHLGGVDTLKDGVRDARAGAFVAAQTLDEQLAGPEEIQLRIAASLSGSLGIVGLVLAGIGVYGVTAYTVTRRTREIGVRLALGASRADVTRMVLRHGLSLMVIGSAVGLALAAGASRLLASGLHGVPPLDPLAFAGSAALFAAVGIGACYVPVRRAVRINAMEALRCE